MYAATINGVHVEPMAFSHFSLLETFLIEESECARQPCALQSSRGRGIDVCTRCDQLAGHPREPASHGHAKIRDAVAVLPVANIKGRKARIGFVFKKGRRASAVLG